MNEIWKDIPGFENLYQVSNLGRIKALQKTRINGQYGQTTRTYPEKIMKPSKAGKAKYLLIQLRKQNKAHWFSIHRIVAKCFIENPLKLPEVNHIDSNKLNNVAGNLEWMTRKQNARHAMNNGRYTTLFSSFNNPSKSKVK